jgi:hypothetical protein
MDKNSKIADKIKNDWAIIAKMVERATKSQKRLTKSKKWLGQCRSIK